MKTTFAAAMVAAMIPAAIHAQQALDVRPGPLGAALTDLGLRAGVQIVVPAALVAGRSTPGVTGAPSVAAALDGALVGTGLGWREVGPGAITLYPLAAGDEGATLLAPIVVAGGVGYRPGTGSTGTRTDTPLRDVPQTVDVVAREQIEERQATSLTAALEGVPNVTENSTSGNRGETYILRGFEAGNYAIDGTVLNATGDRPEVMADLAGVERVEVLKGPASVLYGRGQPGGMINIVTRRPDAVPGAEIGLQAGSYGFGRIEGTATGALSDTVAARITGAAQTDDGFIDGRPKSERQYLGTVLEWTPGDATRLNFGLERTHMKQPFDRGVPVLSDNTVLEPYDTWLAEGWAMIDAKKTRATIGAEHDVNAGLTLRGNLALDDALVHDTGIDHEGIDDRADGSTWLNRRYTDRTEDTRNLDARLEAELRFATGAVDHTLLLGAQFTDSRMEFDSARSNRIDDPAHTLPPINVYDPLHGAEKPLTQPNNSYDERVLARSVFVQDQITFSPEWKALVGLRYDDVRTTNLAYDPIAQTPDGLENRSDDALTARAGVVWQPRADLSLYASWAQSFAPQSGVDRSGDTLKAEEGEQFEIGAKWDVTPAMTANLSLFQITKTNVAADDPDFEDASILTGEQRVRGIEADVSGQIGGGWILRASVGLLDTEVTKDETEIEGNRLNGVANVTASLWTTYESQNGARVGAGLIHVGSRKGDLDNSFEVDGYTRLDAMASWPLSDRAEISVVARNLTDEDYIVSVAGRNEAHPGAPRSVMAKLDYRF
ncbi:TonB-dependent receptor [Cereibacter sp. SYSU M97828]|nr:TonB-dependent receptor [Cereibacter flavus]